MPPMPTRPTGNSGSSGPSLFDKMKMGAMLGTSVGLIIGFIFGGVNVLRYGAGPNGLSRTLGQYMLGSAATFGFFMSIGSAIRTEASRADMERFRGARRGAVVAGRRRVQWGE